VGFRLVVRSILRIRLLSGGVSVIFVVASKAAQVRRVRPTSLPEGQLLLQTAVFVDGVVQTRNQPRLTSRHAVSVKRSSRMRLFHIRLPNFFMALL
jgi:hypothetical protein